MTFSREQTDDAVRDYLALMSAVRRHDCAAWEAIIGAQHNDPFPLLAAAMGVLESVVRATGRDVDEWISQVQRGLAADSVKRPPPER